MTAPISLAAAHEPRTAEVSRDTAETKIKVRLNLDGTGESKLWAIGSIAIAMMVGLVPYSICLVVQRVFYAYNDAKTPFWLQLVNSGVFVALGLLCALVSSEYRAVAVALAQATSNVVAAVVGIAWLGRRLGGLDLHITVRTWIRSLVACVPAGLAALLLAWPIRNLTHSFLPGPTHGWWTSSVLALLVGGTAAVAVAVTLAALAGAGPGACARTGAGAGVRGRPGARQDAAFDEVALAEAEAADEVRRHLDVVVTRLDAVDAQEAVVAHGLEHTGDRGEF